LTHTTKFGVRCKKYLTIELLFILAFTLFAVHDIYTHSWVDVAFDALVVVAAIYTHVYHTRKEKGQP